MEQLPKGKYYIGDPCYLFDQSWGEVLDSTNFFNQGEISILFGQKCIAGGTAYGDGSYKDQENREYFVDSGMIGCLPVSLIDVDKKFNPETDKYAQIIEFDKPFNVDCEKGVFTFGHIIIDTASSDEED